MREKVRAEHGDLPGEMLEIEKQQYNITLKAALDRFEDKAPLAMPCRLTGGLTDYSFNEADLEEQTEASAAHAPQKVRIPQGHAHRQDSRLYQVFDSARCSR